MIQHSTKQKPPAANNKLPAAATEMANTNDDDLLTRRQIREKYTWSEKTTARIESNPEYGLIPVVIGKNGGRTKRYFRSHIDAVVRAEYEKAFAIRESARKAPANTRVTPQVSIKSVLSAVKLGKGAQ